MTDREMLELAALAAGLVPKRYEGNSDFMDGILSGNSPWNPRDDSGDALRLAVRLRIDVFHYDGDVIADQHGCGSTFASEPYGTDPDAATRLAILRCAAEVGRRMP